MATANSDSESDNEIFQAALKKVEEAAKPLPKKSPTAKKKEKLIALSNDGLIDKPANFIRKANKSVVDKMYDEYENQRMSCASDFVSALIISKFALVLGSFNAVESAEKLSEELLNDKLLKDDVTYLTRSISPHIPFIGLISGGCTTAKHVVAHKWSKPKVEHKEVCVNVVESNVSSEVKSLIKNGN
jgi:hypothetical protein